MPCVHRYSRGLGGEAVHACGTCAECLGAPVPERAGVRGEGGLWVSSSITLFLIVSSQGLPVSQMFTVLARLSRELSELAQLGSSVLGLQAHTVMLGFRSEY